jgi:hypothetical protein
MDPEEIPLHKISRKPKDARGFPGIRKPKKKECEKNEKPKEKECKDSPFLHKTNEDCCCIECTEGM